jgi:hypothetical protein
MGDEKEYKIGAKREKCVYNQIKIRNSTQTRRCERLQVYKLIEGKRTLTPYCGVHGGNRDNEKSLKPKTTQLRLLHEDLEDIDKKVEAIRNFLAQVHLKLEKEESESAPATSSGGKRFRREVPDAEMQAEEQKRKQESERIPMSNESI